MELILVNSQKNIKVDLKERRTLDPMTPIKIHVMAKTLPAAKHRIATSLFPGSGMGRKSEK